MKIVALVAYVVLMLLACSLFAGGSHRFREEDQLDYDENMRRQ